MLKVGDIVTFHSTSWGPLKCIGEGNFYFQFSQIAPTERYLGIINVSVEYIMRTPLNYYTPKNQLAPASVPSPFTPVPIVNTPVQLTVVCSHDWRWYDSGWSRFEYCFKCNAERNIGT